MSNPINLNTTYIKKFGFKSDFLLEEKKIRFDITGYTEFEAGGAAVSQGINFEVVDPSGVILSVIDFPSKDIDPALGQTTYEVVLPNGFAMFGWFIIRGVIKDADGKEYEIKVVKNICEPKGFKNGVVKGSFDANVNCEAPKISLTETTDMSYAGLSPYRKTKEGVLYYPKGTLNDLAFTFTPFEIAGSNDVYTGSYTVRNKTIAEYDLGDLVYVHVSYNTSHDFEVNCNSTLCKVLCCVQDMMKTYEDDCKSNKGKDAKAKLDKIALPLMIATLKEKCGQNAGDEIAEIEDILGCACECGNESVEPKLLIGNSNVANSVTVVGDCGTTVTPQTVGNSVQYTVKSKNIVISKGDDGDLSFSIKKVEDACTINYEISFDYNNLATTILNTIKNSSQLTAIFNSIFQSTGGIDLAGLDGKCVVDLAACDYTLVEKITGVISVLNIVIGGQTFVAPSGLLLQNDVAVSDWLNSMAKGVFNVFYDTNTQSVIITSPANSNSIATILLSNGTSSFARVFSKNCKGLKQILQAVINYVCAISATQVKLGGSLVLCRFKPDGTIEQVPFNSDATLFSYLDAQRAALCDFANKINAITGIDCAKMKSLFPQTTKIVGDADYLFGTKEGECARLSYVEIAKIVLTKAFENSEIRTYICEQMQNCSQPVCTPVDNITVVLDTAATCMQLTNIQGTVA